eukprot:EG_transcript_27843
MIAPALMLPFVLFAGFLNPGDSMPVWCSWLRYVSYYWYAFGAAVKNEFVGQTFTCSPNEPCYATGEAVMKRYSFQDVSIAANCIVVLAFAAAFQLLGFVTLWWRCRKNLAQ